MHTALPSSPRNPTGRSENSVDEKAKSDTITIAGVGDMQEIEQYSVQDTFNEDYQNTKYQTSLEV